VMYICIGKQKVVWIPKLKENGWVVVVSALMSHLEGSLYHACLHSQALSWVVGQKAES
jgi:hypothetical protein